MTGGREHQGSSCRGVGVVRLEPFDPSSGSGRGLLAESSNAEDVRPKATARFDLAFFWIARWCVAFVPGAYPARSGSSVPPVWKSTSVSGALGHPVSLERRGTGIATPSSRHRVDGVVVDATIQHERAVTFDFHTVDDAVVALVRRMHI